MSMTNGGTFDFITKAELMHLKKAGLLSKMFKTTPYSDANENGTLPIIYYDFLTHSSLCYIDSTTGNIDFNVKDEHSYIGIAPVITYKKGFPNGLVEKGNDTVKLGRHIYALVKGLEVNKLDKELSLGNMIPTGGKYGNLFEYIYNNKYYARGTNGLWADVRDVEWIVDSEHNRLICKNIIDYAGRELVFNTLLQVEKELTQNSKSISNYNILLTEAEEKNSLPFFVPTKEMIEPNTRNKTLQYVGVDFDITEFAYMMGGRKPSEKFIVDELVSYDSSEIYRISIRPCINYDFIRDKSKIISHSSLYDLVSYGEYISSCTSIKKMDELEFRYLSGELMKTNKSYHLIEYSKEKGNYEFEIKEYPEYEYEGNKYVRLNIKLEEYELKYLNLPKDYKIINKGVVWVKVEEIKWLVDKETNIAIAEKGLLKLGKKEDLCDVKLSLVKNYLKKYFSIDIVPSKILTKAKSETLNKVEETETTGDNIMLQIIVKKYNLMSEKEKIEKIKKVIEGNEILQRLMEKNNLIPADIGLDENDNPIVRGLRI